MTRVRITACAATAALVALIGCGSTPTAPSPPPDREPPWHVDAAAVLQWQAVHEAFAQDRALEASGMTSVGDELIVVSEKYATALRLVPGDEWRAETVALAVPPGAELEGVAFHEGNLYICDEANAVVYRVPFTGRDPGSAALAAAPLSLEGISVRGGKVGLEGVAVDAQGQLFLLLERDRLAEGGCVSVVYPMKVGEHSLEATREPLVVNLEDCDWRLTGLEIDRGRLIALKTRYPGEQYQVIEIDTLSGQWSVLLELTELAQDLEREGWGNNLEGLTVTDDGDLYMISDNAVTDVARSADPPPARDRTLLIRVPAVTDP